MYLRTLVRSYDCSFPNDEGVAEATPHLVRPHSVCAVLPIVRSSEWFDRYWFTRCLWVNQAGLHGVKLRRRGEPIVALIRATMACHGSYSH